MPGASCTGGSAVAVPHLRPPSRSAGDVPVVAAPVAAPPLQSRPTRRATVINVRTDVLDVDMSLRGGELQRADLLDYPVVKGQPTPVRLLRNKAPATSTCCRPALPVPAPRCGRSLPHPPGAVPQRLRRLPDGQPGLDELRVPLKWTSPEGVKSSRR